MFTLVATLWTSVIVCPAEADPEDDHDYAASDVRPARGRRPIFECYWNGRLIPYSFIDEWVGVASAHVSSLMAAHMDKQRNCL